MTMNSTLTLLAALLLAPLAELHAAEHFWDEIGQRDGFRARPRKPVDEGG